MTRRSRRELERAVDALSGERTPTITEIFWADLRDYYDADLTASEQRALAAWEDR
jgi:hypothetical protein